MLSALARDVTYLGVVPMSAKRSTIMWLLILILVSVFLVAGGTMRVYLHNIERFPKGFRIGDIDVSGLDEVSAESLIEVYASKVMGLPITLRFGKQQWTVEPKDVGFAIDVTKTVGNAWLSLLDPRFPTFIPIRRPLGEVNEAGFVYDIDEGKLAKVLDKISLEVTIRPRNAMFVTNADDTISVSNSSAGMGIDLEWAVSEIKKVLFFDKGRTIVLKSISIEPAISKDDLMATGITGLLSEYRTSFDSSDEDRTHNIRLVSAAIDGVILRPQEVFSFNRIVGPRTKSRGYRDATVIVNSQKSIDVGGGICQVSSTLYNAALLANLEIIERQPHSVPVTYISPGRDATVSYDFLDLRFANTCKTSVLVRASVVNNQVVIKIYGNPNPRQRVFVKVTEYENLLYSTRDVLDPSLEKGVKEVHSEGSPGYRAVVTRIVEEDGMELVREQISEDICLPQERTVHIGTGNG
jgi:vancomycin resistance protein YoaR